MQQSFSLDKAIFMQQELGRGIVLQSRESETLETVAGVDLAFRELPLVLEAVKKLETEPDLYIFDGNGYLHPRHMGIATHASFYLRKATIGVAKHYYKIADTDFIMPENREFAYTDIETHKIRECLQSREIGML